MRGAGVEGDVTMDTDVLEGVSVLAFDKRKGLWPWTEAVFRGWKGNGISPWASRRSPAQLTPGFRPATPTLVFPLLGLCDNLFFKGGEPVTVTQEMSYRTQGGSWGEEKGLALGTAALPGRGLAHSPLIISGTIHEGWSTTVYCLLQSGFLRFCRSLECVFFSTMSHSSPKSATTTFLLWGDDEAGPH